MDELAKHIERILKERAFCLVFEAELERCWPIHLLARPEREREIQNFAESEGWTAVIVEGEFGTRVIFQRLKPGSVDY